MELLTAIPSVQDLKIARLEITAAWLDLNRNHTK